MRPALPLASLTTTDSISYLRPSPPRRHVAAYHTQPLAIPGTDHPPLLWLRLTRPRSRTGRVTTIAALSRRHNNYNSPARLSWDSSSAPDHCVIARPALLAPIWSPLRRSATVRQCYHRHGYQRRTLIEPTAACRRSIRTEDHCISAAALYSPLHPATSARLSSTRFHPTFAAPPHPCPPAKASLAIQCLPTPPPNALASRLAAIMARRSSNFCCAG